jgi:lipoate-protein ligase B
MPSHREPVRCTIRRPGLVAFDEALELQRQAVESCAETGVATLLLLEHPPTYTLGSRSDASQIIAGAGELKNLGVRVHHTNRGGEATFHGPGQLVGYPILNLRIWGQGPVWYVRSLEEALIRALAEFGVDGERRCGHPGVWRGDAKIASIGVHVSRGITSHGFALNIDPDLTYFDHIVPCGIPGLRVTSVREVAGGAPPMDAAMDALERALVDVFDLEIQTPEFAGVA